MDAGPDTGPTQGPVGVRGWLLFFCLSLTVFSPLLTVVNLVSAYGQTSPLFDRFPGLQVVTLLDALLSFGLMAFSIHAGISLWRRQPGAVRTAKRYLVTLLAYTAISCVLPFLAGLPREAHATMLAEVAKGLARSLVFVGIWYSYLNKSRRVRNTFP
jgi:uncharacterized protein DUF2569